MIDWSNADYVENGYFWNTVKSVTIGCAANLDQTQDTTGWTYIENANGAPVSDG